MYYKRESPMSGAHRQLMRNLTLAFLLLLLRPSPAIFRRAVASEECGGRQPLVEWQTLTKLNYSSEIRLHPHLLLLVTVPWSGESRSLMKQLGHAVNSEQCIFGSLKLRVLFRNSERMLADVLGANTGISVLYYHHSLFYKYHGRLRAHNILSSVHYVMSLLPEELPLKSLNTPEELKAFLDSTDKALLLLEFCGWTHKVLASGKNNGTEYGLGLNEELNGTISTNESTAEKGTKNEKMDCDIDDGVGFIPQLNKFTLGNDSALSDAGNMTHGGSSCEINEFVRFKSFLEKSMTVAREFFLPPERLKFGLVPNRSLLSVLNIEDPGSWLMTLQVAGCPTCSTVLKEGDDLKTIIQTQASLIAELENDADDAGLILPANKPSMLLFVDRSSDSSTLRQESKKAMDAFRELALHYHNSHMESGKDTLISKKTSAETIQELKTTSKHHRLDLFQPQNINVNDKMSIVIMNEGKHVSVENLVANLQGSSLHEILAYALKQKKELKLSTIAKGAGFQLLSEDLNVELSDTLAVQEGDHSDQVSESPTENVSKDTLDSESSHSDPSNVNMEYAQPLVVQSEVQSDQHSEGNPVVVQEGTLDSDKHQVPEKENIFYGEHVAQSELYASESFQQNSNKNIIEHSDVQDATDSLGNEGIFEKTLEVDEQKQEKSFGGSFFFCDGQYRLLRALTGGSTIPSAVIVDPILQRHYVLAEQAVFSHSLLAEFLDKFINGSLPPYQQSEPFAPNPRVAPNPPFVNHDFHEADSIPRVTANSFTELVLGSLSDPMYASNSLSRDVLVLFSNSWCGFCQRMELVVREVYRAIQGYANMLKTAFGDKKMSLTEDGLTNAMVKLPLVYLMDCTLNDCSLIVKPLVQREVYPLLLLFPAESKNAVQYKGDVAVSEIIKFLKEHVNHSYGPIREEDSLRTGTREEELDQKLQKDGPFLKNLYNEVLLKDRMPNSGTKYRQIVSSLNDLHQTPLQVVVGSMLIATDVLLNSHPFDESIILIVKGNHSSGFKGLIVNKRINWDSLDEIEEGLEFLKATPLSYGGPVLRRGMPLVALSKRVIEDHHPQVLPNIYFLDQVATLRLLDEVKSGNQSIHDVWFFLGFSTWDGNQLVNEIIEGSWTLSKGTEEQLGWPLM